MLRGVKNHIYVSDSVSKGSCNKKDFDHAIKVAKDQVRKAPHKVTIKGINLTSDGREALNGEGM